MGKSIVVDERIIASRNEGGNITSKLLTVLLFVDLVLHAFLPGMLRIPVDFPGGLFKEGFPADLFFLFVFIPVMSMYNAWKREFTVGGKDIILTAGISLVVTGIIVAVIYLI